MTKSSPIELRESERIIEVFSQYWLRFGLILASLVVLFTLPFFFLWPLFKLGYFGLAIFAFLVFTLAVLMLREFYKWRNTTLIATTKRIVVKEQRALFNSITSEVALTTLADVEEQRRGFWQTVAGYGTVILRADGRTDPIYFHHVGRPHFVRQMLLELRDTTPDNVTELTGEWWWDRFVQLEGKEQHTLLAKARSLMGEDKWRELFRPYPDA
ncbi:MAG: hypothetical protein WC817_02925 [Patescibacteria group bacterium]|jgi:hypothetical protein